MHFRAVARAPLNETTGSPCLALLARHVMLTNHNTQSQDTRPGWSTLLFFLSLSLSLPRPVSLQVNDSSPKTVLSQLCELMAARPLQGLVYEEERPPRTAWGPLAPMLEFVSAQTGLPIVAVGGGAGLGRMPQVRGGRSGVGTGG